MGLNIHKHTITKVKKWKSSEKNRIFEIHNLGFIIEIIETISSMAEDAGTTL